MNQRLFPSPSGRGIKGENSPNPSSRFEPRNAAFRRQQAALRRGAPCRLKAAFRRRFVGRFVVRIHPTKVCALNP